MNAELKAVWQIYRPFKRALVVSVSCLFLSNLLGLIYPFIAGKALDALNEDDIVRSIREVSRGKTTLMIAHRFSTILSADEIIVMDNGKVVGQGTHRALYNTCPAYAKLVGPQIKIVERLLVN